MQETILGIVIDDRVPNRAKFWRNGTINRVRSSASLNGIIARREPKN